MPTITVEETTQYVVQQPFETTVDTIGTEFVAQGNSNGLPRESLLKRTFLMGAEATIQIDGITVNLPQGKALRDVGQAQKVLKQSPASILVRDRIRVEAGQLLPAALGQALAETRRYPVREALAPAEEQAQSAPNKAEEDAAAKKSAEAPAKKAAAAEVKKTSEAAGK